MITFKNERQIKEWIVNLENHVTMLKANLVCDKRQCLIVYKTTDGFLYKSQARESINSIRNCASMINQYLE